MWPVMVVEKVDAMHEITGPSDNAVHSDRGDVLQVCEVEVV